jgi:hypothetical protein
VSFRAGIGSPPAPPTASTPCLIEGSRDRDHGAVTSTVGRSYDPRRIEVLDLDPLGARRRSGSRHPRNRTDPLRQEAVPTPALRQRDQRTARERSGPRRARPLVIPPAASPRDLLPWLASLPPGLAPGHSPHAAPFRRCRVVVREPDIGQPFLEQFCRMAR